MRGANRRRRKGKNEGLLVNNITVLLEKKNPEAKNEKKKGVPNHLITLRPVGIKKDTGEYQPKSLRRYPRLVIPAPIRGRAGAQSPL